MSKTVGKKLKSLREYRGISQNELARRLGHSTNSYVSNVEQGLFVPSEDKLQRIAHALEIPFDMIKDAVLEARIEGLGIKEPALIGLLRDYPNLSDEEREQILQAYNRVRPQRL